MPTVLQAERLDVTTIPKGRWLTVFCRGYRKPIVLKFSAKGTRPIVDVVHTVFGTASGVEVSLIGCTRFGRVFNGEIRPDTRLVIGVRTGKKEQVVMDGIISHWKVSRTRRG